MGDQPDVTVLARTSGLGRREVTLTAVERRRLEVAFVTLLFVVAAAAAAVTAGEWTETPRSFGVDWLSITNGRLALLAVAVGFGAYVVQTELALHRLTALLVEERARSVALEAEAADLAALLAAASAATGSHTLEEALDGVLRQAVALAGVDRGAVFMAAEGTDDLVARASHRGGDAFFGGQARRGVGPIGWVALRGEPAAFGPSAGADPTAYAVPLSWRGQVVGVLALATDDAIDGRAQRLIEAFAPHGAAAIANARLHEFDRERWLRSARSEVAQDFFVTALSHELRTPLTALFGAVRTLERVDVSPAQQTELVAMIERQSRRLMSMVDGLINAAVRRQDEVASLEVIDMAALVEAAARHEGVLERSVEVVLDLDDQQGATVLGRVEDLRVAVAHVLDNAFVHGSSPVVATVRHDRREVKVEIRDHGPGIPVERRGMVLQRFARLDAAHSTPGLGLGLPTAAELLHRSGGRLTIDTPADGVGTVVTLHLRAAPA